MLENDTCSLGPLGPLSVTVPALGNGSTLAQDKAEARHWGFAPDKVTIMIVDNESINIELLKLYLAEAGYTKFLASTEISHAMTLTHSARPDAILLDVMQNGAGLRLLGGLRNDRALRHIPVIILTAMETVDWKLKALELGVNDFLAKPVDPAELSLRLRNTLAAKALQDHLSSHSARLAQQVRQRTAELEAARREAMECLARASEYRDDDTGKHVLRVGRYAGIVALRLGFDEKRAETLELAAQLHDVGKIGVSDAILLKPGKLDEAEFELMKEHCAFGRKIIRPLTDEEWNHVRRHPQVGASILGTPSSPIMKLAAKIAETHHEWWDGTGYPHGLKGNEIPIEGRITAVADVFDALSSERPYKEAFANEKCFSIMDEGRGKHFDPRILDAFFACIHVIRKVQREFADE